MLCTAMLFTSSSLTHAQKIYRVTGTAAEYKKKAGSDESYLLQQVHSAFSHRKDVTVIDFTGAVTADGGAYKQQLRSFLKDANFFRLSNTEGLAVLQKNAPDALVLIMPFKNRTITVDFIKADIFTADFKLYTDKDPAGLPDETGIHYKGVVRGNKSLASISLFDKKLEGYISIGKEAPVEITRLRGNNPDGEHVIYSDDDLLVKGKDHFCRTIDPGKNEMLKLNTNVSEGPAATYKCVTNFWETSFSMYQYFGSKKAVQDYALSLFNVYATIYTNENISMKLNAGFVWTGPDPYGDNLSTFSSKRTGFNANLAMLLSTGGGGGVAWLNSLCNSGDYYRHSFCGSVGDNLEQITSYTWPANVTTHEVGHNLGSPHTHACAWNNNNTAIDGCGPAAGYSEGCNGPVPSAGTIMSYCHLVTSVDLTLGFGPQPGNLIRNTVNSCINTSCTAIGTSCNAPAGVNTTNITSNAATVSWKKVDGAAYYYIYLSKDNGATFQLAATDIYGTSYRLAGLLSSRNYICDVWAACANGDFNSTRTTFTTTSGIASAETAGQLFTVFPNPVTGRQFTVNLQSRLANAKVELLNSQQQVLAVNNTAGAIRLFTAPAVQGVYYVRVTSKEEVISQKILVE